MHNQAAVETVAGRPKTRLIPLVGAIAGFALQSKPDARTLSGLSVVLVLGSVIGVVGGTISRQWIAKTKQLLSDVCRELELACAPLESAERIVMLEQSIAGLLLVAGRAGQAAPRETVPAAIRASISAAE